jgi:amino acid transporter
MGGRTHARSTKESSVVNLVLTGVHVVFILFIIVMGFAHGDARNLSRPADPAHSPGGFFPHGAAGVFNGAAAVYLSYIGYDAVSTMAEEVERPDRDIPAGVSGSVVLVTVLYCLMATSMSMLLPYDAVRTSVSQSACLPSEMKEDAKSAAMYSDSATATGIVFYDTFADIGRAIWNESILYSAVPIPIAEGTSCNFLGVKKSEREREKKKHLGTSLVCFPHKWAWTWTCGRFFSTGSGCCFPVVQIDPEAPFSGAFKGRDGMAWVSNVIGAGASLGILTSLMVAMLGQARYLCVIGRSGVVPAWLARVDPRTATPINASAFLGA